MVSMLLAAGGYAERLRWPVFPVHTINSAGRCTCGNPHCDRPAKHPWILRGLDDATVELGVIARLWAQHPHANIGIVTSSTRAVLDVDADKGGEDSLFALERQHGPLPATPRQRTGGGGWHYVFHVAGVVVPNRVGLPGFPGLDVRGQRGYIVAAPSLHASGRRYVWEHDAHPLTTPIAPMPSWLLARILAARESHLQRHGVPLEIVSGTRNEYLFRFASLFRRYGLNGRAIVDALVAINREHARPPLSLDEVRAIAASAARYESGDARP